MTDEKEEDQLVAFSAHLSKLSYQIGLERGWNQCIEDIRSQLSKDKNLKNLVLQYKMGRGNKND